MKVCVVLLISFLQILWSAGTVLKGKKLVIDQDGGGDDAMAIFMALLNEEYFEGPHLVALTTVHGNVHEPQVFNNSQRILDIARRRNVPIYRGCESALVEGFLSDYFFGNDGLGDNDTVEFDPIAAQPDHAALALIELSKKHEGELIVVGLGALTNIALAIKLDPEFISRLDHLYIAAGNVYNEMHSSPEFNARMDVEAYRITMNYGNPEKMTIIPFSQIRNNISISLEWRKEVLGAIPTDIMRAQNVFEQVSLSKVTIWNILDPVGMAIVLNYSAIVEDTRYSDNSIELCGENRGINTNIFTSAENATARMVYSVSEDAYKQFLLEVFSTQLHQ